MYMNIYQWGRARSACGGIDTTQYAHTSREDSIFTCFETTQFAHSCVETALCRPVCRNNTVCVYVCRKKTVLSVEDCKRKVSCMRIVCAYCLCGYCAHTCHTQYTVFYTQHCLLYSKDTVMLRHTYTVCEVSAYSAHSADTCHRHICGYMCGYMSHTVYVCRNMTVSVEYGRQYWV